MPAKIRNFHRKDTLSAAASSAAVAKNRKPLANGVVPCAIDSFAFSISDIAIAERTTSWREIALLSMIRSIGPSASPYRNFADRRGRRSDRRSLPCTAKAGFRHEERETMRRTDRRQRTQRCRSHCVSDRDRAARRRTGVRWWWGRRFSGRIRPVASSMYRRTRPGGHAPWRTVAQAQSHST